MKKSILLLLLFTACNFTAVLLAKEAELKIELKAKKPLTPIYLSKLHAPNLSSKKEHLNLLYDTLCFDLEHSGYFAVLDKQDSLENILEKNEWPTTYSKADYILKPVVFGNTLDLLVFHTKTKTVKKFENIPLEFQINKDRLQMHKLANSVLKSLFYVKGIWLSKILFSVHQPNSAGKPTDWIAEIWQCDADGANAHPITSEQSYAITPVYLPFKDRYLYVCYKNGQPKIYTNSLHRKTGVPLLPLRGNQLLPAVCQDKIAFISDAAGRADLFVQRIDETGLQGKPIQLFSHPNSTQASPTFHPSGNKVAFVSDKDGSARVYMLSLNKKQTPRLITKTNKENICPSWSPDGTKLAYSAKTSGIRQIWIYDFLTEQEYPLTSGPLNKENPCWAKDSFHLVFNTTDSGHCDLYLINLNQPQPAKLTSGPGIKHYPTWEMN